MLRTDCRRPWQKQGEQLEDCCKSPCERAGCGLDQGGSNKGSEKRSRCVLK